jgi:hypothetical protein
MGSMNFVKGWAATWKWFVIIIWKGHARYLQ